MMTAFGIVAGFILGIVFTVVASYVGETPIEWVEQKEPKG